MLLLSLLMSLASIQAHADITPPHMQNYTIEGSAAVAIANLLKGQNLKFSFAQYNSCDVIITSSAGSLAICKDNNQPKNIILKAADGTQTDLTAVSNIAVFVNAAEDFSHFDHVDQLVNGDFVAVSRPAEFGQGSYNNKFECKNYGIFRRSFQCVVRAPRSRY